MRACGRAGPSHLPHVHACTAATTPGQLLTACQPRWAPDPPSHPPAAAGGRPSRHTSPSQSHASGLRGAPSWGDPTAGHHGEWEGGTRRQLPSRAPQQTGSWHLHRQGPSRDRTTPTQGLHELSHGRPSELQGSGGPSKELEGQSPCHPGGSTERDSASGSACCEIHTDEQFLCRPGCGKTEPLSSRTALGALLVNCLPGTTGPLTSGIQKGWTLDGTTLLEARAPGWLANVRVMGPWGAPSTAHSPQGCPLTSLLPPAAPSSQDSATSGNQ